MKKCGFYVTFVTMLELGEQHAGRRRAKARRGWVALEIRERLVERLPFGWLGCGAVEQVGFVKFGEPGEELGAVADGQPGQFFKDLSFAHGVNLARRLFSRKHGVKRCASSAVVSFSVRPTDFFGAA